MAEFPYCLLGKLQDLALDEELHEEVEVVPPTSLLSVDLDGFFGSLLDILLIILLGLVPCVLKNPKLPNSQPNLE